MTLPRLRLRRQMSQRRTTGGAATAKQRQVQRFKKILRNEAEEIVLAYSPQPLFQTPTTPRYWHNSCGTIFFGAGFREFTTHTSRHMLRFPFPAHFFWNLQIVRLRFCKSIKVEQWPRNFCFSVLVLLIVPLKTTNLLLVSIYVLNRAQRRLSEFSSFWNQPTVNS